VLNTPPLVAAATRDRRYAAEANRAVPRKIGSKLWLFDCINCDKCVPVCPNDANFAYETAPLRIEYESWRVTAGGVVRVPGGLFEVRKAHQLANFQDFCNDCGNCDTFCPEDGGPYVEKPRFFGSMDAWSKQPGRNGFFVRRQGDMDAAWGRLDGREYCLEVDRARDRALFTDGVVTVDVHHSRRSPAAAWAKPDAPEGYVLDFAAYLRMALALDGVLDPSRANPVNAPYL
jgi:putative selenate reductase